MTETTKPIPGSLAWLKEVRVSTNRRAHTNLIGEDFAPEPSPYEVTRLKKENDDLKRSYTKLCDQMRLLQASPAKDSNLESQSHRIAVEYEAKQRAVVNTIVKALKDIGWM